MANDIGMREWCVMPNHVHAVLTPIRHYGLKSITHSWKSFTANCANEALSLNGPFWERESFDHACRKIEHAMFFKKYVRDNPVKAGLCAKAEEWLWGSAHIRTLKNPTTKEMTFWWETEAQRMK